MCRPSWSIPFPSLCSSNGSGPLSPWGPTTRLKGDIASQIQESKRQSGKDIALYAGPTAASMFMKLDLIDEWPLRPEACRLTRSGRGRAEMAASERGGGTRVASLDGEVELPVLVVYRFQVVVLAE